MTACVGVYHGQWQIPLRQGMPKLFQYICKVPLLDGQQVQFERIGNN